MKNYNIISKLNFDLAYLTLLTQSGLKPLSRWEKWLHRNEEKIIESLGLKSAHVNRLLRNGSSTTEFIFSQSERLLNLYMKRFNGTYIDHSHASMRIKGFLFGYPPCCVDNFIKNGYADNHLDHKDQEILFHWSCPECTITPFLLPEYNQIYKICKDLFSGKINRRQKLYVLEKTRKNVAVAASLALLAAGIYGQLPDKANASVFENDPHWLPLEIDSDKDGDFIEDKLENIIGLNSSIADTDSNGVLDGIQLAKELCLVYEKLPHEVRKDSTYVVDYLMRGLEKCNVCDTTINMGYAVIVNPLENLSIEVPYISLHHFLKHGSFAYDGDVHGKGSVNASILNCILKSDGSWHRIKLTGDNDQDGVADKQEPFLGTDKEQADSDYDGLYDGVKWARRFATQIDSLPREVKTDQIYAIEQSMKGIENCLCCGQIFNMGFLEIVNPMRDLSINVPFIAVHFMTCGSFNFEGDENKGTVDIKQLRAVLSAKGDLHQLPVINDTDEDGLKDNEESRFQNQQQFWDTDSNGESDGSQVAKTLAGVIQNLPDTQHQTQPYVEHYQTFGLESCEVCGEEINMGFMRIINPNTQDSLDINYIALHYMEHGSFSFYGNLHQGRVDPVHLADILEGNVSSVIPQKNKPEEFTLGQNYPNPFNPETIIPFTVPGKDPVIISLKIYNILGELTRTLLEDEIKPGPVLIKWEGKNDTREDVPSGIYFVQFRVGDIVKTQKMTLMR